MDRGKTYTPYHITVLMAPKDNLRLATPADISRMGLVMSAGFGSTLEAAWLQPYLRTFPRDSLLTSQEYVDRCMGSKGFATVVIEDTYEPAEVQAMAEIVPEDEAREHSMYEEKVVAGMATWKFMSGSPRIGQFNDELHVSDLETLSPSRDEHRDHTRRFHSKNRDLRKKYFHGSNWFELHTLVVNPAYWRRGHGRRLLEWGIRVACIDQVELCICAAGSALKLYQASGCELLESWQLEGDEVSPEGVAGHLMRYTPEKECSNTEADESQAEMMALSEQLAEADLGREQNNFPRGKA